VLVCLQFNLNTQHRTFQTLGKRMEIWMYFYICSPLFAKIFSIRNHAQFRCFFRNATL